MTNVLLSLGKNMQINCNKQAYRNMYLAVFVSYWLFCYVYMLLHFCKPIWRWKRAQPGPWHCLCENCVLFADHIAQMSRFALEWMQHCVEPLAKKVYSKMREAYLPSAPTLRKVTDMTMSAAFAKWLSARHSIWHYFHNKLSGGLYSHTAL